MISRMEERKTKSSRRKWPAFIATILLLSATASLVVSSLGHLTHGWDSLYSHHFTPVFKNHKQVKQKTIQENNFYDAKSIKMRIAPVTALKENDLPLSVTTRTRLLETPNAKHSREQNSDIARPREPRSKHHLPKVLITGVKKAGTTALLQILSLHPTVAAPLQEIHFFNIYYHKGLMWYRQVMPETLPSQVTLEKTPTYFTDGQEVAMRIFKFNPKLKFLIVVRDPVLRAISDFSQAQLVSYSLNSNLTSIWEALTYRNSNGAVVVQQDSVFIQRGIYINHLMTWLKYFPLHQFHFVKGEELALKPTEEVVKVEKFLGLKNYFSEKNFYFNKAKGFPCFISWPLKRKFCLPDDKGRKHVPVDRKLVQLLRNYYKPFNERFSKVVRQQFNW